MIGLVTSLSLHAAVAHSIIIIPVFPTRAVAQCCAKLSGGGGEEEDVEKKESSELIVDIAHTPASSNHLDVLDQRNRWCLLVSQSESICKRLKEVHPAGGVGDGGE